MKSTIRFTTVAAFVFATATMMTAAPRAKAFGTSTSRPPERAAPADHRPAVTYMCKECVNGTMEACKAGDTVTCALCNTKFVPAAKGRPANRPAGRKIVFVNDRGDECIFIAKAVDKS